jgi:diguanylate cyclase (GGDEF)-like protein
MNFVERLGLDPRTVVVIDLVMITVISAVLIQNAIQHRRVPGTLEWAIGSVALLGGIILLSFDTPVIPWQLNALIYNVLLMGQPFLLALGLYRLAGLAVPTRILGPVIGAHFAVVLVCTFFVPDQTIRAVSFSITISVILALCIQALMRVWRTRGGVAAPTLAGFLGFQILVFAGYATTKLIVQPFGEPVGQSLTVVPSTLVLLFLGFMLEQLLQGFGLIMLTGDRVQHDLDFLATHDQLTGALARHAFMERALTTAADCGRTRRPITVLFLDLDNFKQVNDRYGHPAGDAVLRGFADRVQHILRANDTFSRLGGEEFAVLLPDTDFAGACVLAERVRRAVEAKPYGYEGTEISITTSIGLCARAGNADMAFEAMINRADKALYKAKAQGRNRVESLSDDVEFNFLPSGPDLVSIDQSPAQAHAQAEEDLAPPKIM